MNIKYLFLIPLFLVSCEKGKLNPESTSPFTKTKIKKMENEFSWGVNKDFIYEGDKLVNMMGEELFYDLNGRLEKSRIAHPEVEEPTRLIFGGSEGPIEIESSSQSTYYYSYQWEQNKVKRIQIDSLIKVKTINGVKSVEKSLINSLFCAISYDGDLISSLEYHKNLTTYSVDYSYDENGNLSKSHYRYLESDKWSPSPKPMSITVLFDEYDDKFNPYHLIYKTLGTITPSFLGSIEPVPASDGGWNHSANNVLECRVSNDATRLESYNTISYSYEYNSKGFPVKIGKKNQALANSLTSNIFITYF